MVVLESSCQETGRLYESFRKHWCVTMQFERGSLERWLGTQLIPSFKTFMSSLRNISIKNQTTLLLITSSFLMKLSVLGV